LKNKLKMPRVRSLCVTRDIAMPRVSVTIRCHYVDFDLIPIYVFLFQFGTHLCVSDSILSQFFNKKNIFVIHFF